MRTLVSLVSMGLSVEERLLPIGSRTGNSQPRTSPSALDSRHALVLVFGALPRELAFF